MTPMNQSAIREIREALERAGCEFVLGNSTNGLISREEFAKELLICKQEANNALTALADLDARGKWRPNVQRRLDLYGEIMVAATFVADDLKENAAGDAHEYNGSMNHVEWLKEALEAYRHEFDCDGKPLPEAPGEER